MPSRPLTLFVAFCALALSLACLGGAPDEPSVAPPPEPSPAQRYAQDCAATLGYVSLGDEVSADEAECERLEIDQSCAPDWSGCDEQTERCRQACLPACSACRAGCVEGCEGCKAACADGDSACISACGLARASCQIVCLQGRSPCLNACGEAWGPCNEAFERQRAQLCPDCALIERCSVGGDDAARGCPGPEIEESARFPGNDRRCLDWCVGW